MTPEEKSLSNARSSAETRRAILRAARKLFAADSYENVGVRDIARQVGVDPALVNRYFGGKEALFREVLDDGKPVDLWDGASPEELPDRLVSLIMQKDKDSEEDEALLEKWLIMLRSVSSNHASALVHEALNDFILGPVAGQLEGGNERGRAGLALAILMGTGIVKQVMRVRPICDDDDSLLRQRMRNLFALAMAPPGQ